jgi:Electron transfer DM13
MKKIIAVLSFVCIFFSSCKKENTTPSSANEALPTSVTVLATGNFIGSVHSTSGIAKVVKDSTNKLYLVIENFRTAAGPDLRTWVSPDNSGTPYQELGLLKAASGNFFYELDASFYYKTNSHVLIWCRQYSVLFGYAVLQ